MDFVSAKHGNTNPFSVVLFQVNPKQVLGPQWSPSADAAVLEAQ